MLVAHPWAGLGPPAVASALSTFARARGVRRLVLCGAGEACAAVLEAAGAVDAEAVLLFSPSAPEGAWPSDRLRGRPLLVCAPDRYPGLARLVHARALTFAGAKARELGLRMDLDEVRADLAASCVPFLLRSLGPEACQTPVRREA